MKVLNFKNSMMAMIIALVVVSCESKNSNKDQSVADADNSLNNLDFELEKNGLPSHWYAGNGGNRNGNFKVTLDNLEKHSGKMSLKMEMLGDLELGNSGLFTGTLPIDLVAGKTVEFS